MHFSFPQLLSSAVQVALSEATSGPIILYLSQFEGLKPDEQWLLFELIHTGTGKLRQQMCCEHYEAVVYLLEAALDGEQKYITFGSEVEGNFPVLLTQKASAASLYSHNTTRSTCQ